MNFLVNIILCLFLAYGVWCCFRGYKINDWRTILDGVILLFGSFFAFASGTWWILIFVVAFLFTELFLFPSRRTTRLTLLRKISQQLTSKSSEKEIEDLISNFVNKTRDQRESALKNLYYLSLSDKRNAELLYSYDITLEKYYDLYHWLVLHGAGQKAGGYYVATAALVFNTPLVYLLSMLKINESEVDKYQADKIVYDLIVYFDKAFFIC